MPTYSYQCDHCQHHFDIFQRFTDDALVTCPNCHEDSLRKVYSPVGIVFKGSGFYATDHRSPSGMSSSNHEAATSESKPADTAKPVEKKETKTKKKETPSPKSTQAAE